MIDEELYDDYEDEEELVKPEDKWKGLTPEEIKWVKDVLAREGRTPDLTERVVNPLTGEVLNEGGPDTPEVHAMREEARRLYWERRKRAREESKAEDFG